MKLFTPIRLTTASVVLGLVSLTGTAAAAGSASLGLSPSGSSYAVNSTFSVTISENSGADPVNVVEADLSFDQSTLQLLGVNCNSAAFEVNAPGSGSGATCGTSTPKTGGQVVATASFKVVAAGASAVNFASSSHIYRSTDNADVWNGVATGGSYSFAAPASAPAPTTSRSNGAVLDANQTATDAQPTSTTDQTAASHKTTHKLAPVQATAVSSTLPSLWVTVLALVAVLAGLGYLQRTRLQKVAVPATHRVTRFAAVTATKLPFQSTKAEPAKTAKKSPAKKSTAEKSTPKKRATK